MKKEKMRARKREGVQRRTSAKCEAIVNILVVTAFFAAELCNSNEERACIAVVSFSRRHFFFFFFSFFSFSSSYIIMVAMFPMFSSRWMMIACKHYAPFSIGIKEM